MNTQELKAGQRFLVKSGTDIIEYSVQEITADGKYHRISPATGPCSQWVELWTLDILHVFEAPVERPYDPWREELRIARTPEEMDLVLKKLRAVALPKEDDVSELKKGAEDLEKSIERLKSIPLTVPPTKEGRRKCLLDIADKMDAIVKEFSAEQKPVTVMGLDPA